MVSAPDTYCTSVQGSPASERASPAAARPYSTKLRPHLPQGCMPAPSTATLLSSGIGHLLGSGLPGGRRRRRGRPPLPNQVLVLVVFVEGVEHDLHFGPDGQIIDG